MSEIIRDERGRFLPGTRPPNTIRSSADARNLAEARWRKYRQAAARGVTAEAMAIDPNVSNQYDAWALVNGRLFQEQMDKPRGDDVAQLGRNIGAVPLAHERAQADQPSTVTHVHTMEPHVLALLEQVRAQQATGQSADVVDAEATSVDVPAQTGRQKKRRRGQR
ncbi:MAG: hypothetical protein AB1564_14505 [Chloroflexota bacterium]